VKAQKEKLRRGIQRCSHELAQADSRIQFEPYPPPATMWLFQDESLKMESESKEGKNIVKDFLYVCLVGFQKYQNLYSHPEHMKVS
jgi:hypothetical protein